MLINKYNCKTIKEYNMQNLPNDYLYITGLHALNLPCNLETCGDWHQSAIQWEKLSVASMRASTFKDYGVEKNKHIPLNQGVYHVADHIRATLDLLQEEQYYHLQGLRDNIIGNDNYTQILFQQVLVLKTAHPESWRRTYQFMLQEYKLQWRDFYARHEQT